MALYSNTKTYNGPKPRVPAAYHGPRDSGTAGETRRRRKRRSALAGTAFRSRQRDKDPYGINSGDPWGLGERQKASPT